MSTKIYGLIINIASSILMSDVDSWKNRMILQLFICLTAAGLVGILFVFAILVHGAKIW